MTEPLVPPSAQESEGSVLAACLTQSGAVDICVGEGLTPDHFYGNPDRWVYTAIVELHSSGCRPDTPLVKQWLTANGKIASVNPHWLNEHIMNTPWVRDIRQHIRAIKGTSRLRNLISVVQQVAAEAYGHSQDPDKFIQLADSRLYEACQTESTRECLHKISDSIREFFEQVRTELLASKEGRTTRVMTGLTQLDKLVGGLLPGLVVVAGRPSMGKTAFALNISAFIASQKLTPRLGVHVISAETRHTILAARLLGQEGFIDTSKMLSSNLQAEEFTRLTQTSKEVGVLPITSDDRSSPTLAQVRSSIRRASTELRRTDTNGNVTQKLGAVVLDYLQLCKNPNKAGNREQEVGAVAYGLLELAKDFDVPIIALAQLSRRCEERADKRPQLSDLRESGNIEQAADMVLGLYRDEHYDQATQDKGVAEVLILKNKNGPTGVVKVRFSPQWMRFDNLEYGDES